MTDAHPQTRSTFARSLTPLAAMLLLAAGCAAETTETTEPPTEDDPVMDPAPDVDVCSATDGVCLDKATCTADPDCAGTNEEPEPGCTPTALPALPTNLLATASGLYQPAQSPSGLALADRVSIVAKLATATKVYNCSLTGCGSTPAGVGTNVDFGDSFVAAFGGHLYWSARSDSLATNPNRLFRANPDGSAPEVVVSVEDDGAGLYGAISKNIAVYDDYALVVDTSAPQQADAGVHVVTDSLVSPSLPGITTPEYAVSAVTADDTYLAYWANPVSGSTAPYDKKIHIYDLEGHALAATATTYYTVRQMQIVGSSLLFMTDLGVIKGCTLPSCSDIKDLGTAVSARGGSFAVANNRVYFASIADQGCGLGTTGVLASCDVTSFLAGTCTPTLHSTSIHWVNASAIAVTATQAAMLTKTSTAAAYITPL